MQGELATGLLSREVTQEPWAGGRPPPEGSAPGAADCPAGSARGLSFCPVLWDMETPTLVWDVVGALAWGWGPSRCLATETGSGPSLEGAAHGAQVLLSQPRSCLAPLVLCAAVTGAGGGGI